MMRRRPSASAPADLFPMFVKLSGRRCIVVGAGRIAESKIAGLVRAGAAVCIVAPRATARIRAWARAGAISWKKQLFKPNHLRGAFLVVVAVPLPAVQEAVVRHARRRGILCNSVDDPARCDFYYPALVRRGALQIAISTAGHSPALAQRLRKQLERQFGPEYARWLSHLGSVREQLFRQPMSVERRRRLLRRLASERAFSDFVRRGAR